MYLQVSPRRWSMSTADKIFRLYQKNAIVNLGGKGEDAVKVVMWKPTYEEARQGQMFLFERISFWETEDGKVAERVEAFLATLPEDKDAIITHLLDQTVAQKVGENVDLLDDVARGLIEADILQSFTPEDYQNLFGIRPGVEKEFEAVLRTKSANIRRDDILPYLVRKDTFLERLNGDLTARVEDKFREEERAQYRKSEIEALKRALGTVNRRTIAMGLALQDYNQYMSAVLTREMVKAETEKQVKGELVFSNDKKSGNFIGEAPPEVIDVLTDNLQEIMNMGRANLIREVVDNGNFPNSAPSPNDSTSPHPVVVVPATSPSTPST
jgi:hypothetical protein